MPPLLGPEVRGQLPTEWRGGEKKEYELPRGRWERKRGRGPRGVWVGIGARGGWGHKAEVKRLRDGY